MVKLVFDGWSVGLRKISLNFLLCEEAGFTTGSAYEFIQRVMDGEVRTVEVSDLRTAERIAEQSRELGAIVRIQSGHKAE